MELMQASWLHRGEEFLVRESPHDAEGYWAGAPAAYYDDDDDVLYLYYRLRRPRGQGRGYEARIAQSRDGVHFQDVWVVTQQQLASPSIERGCLVKQPEGWVLYLSYVHPDTHQWQIDRIDGDRPETLNIATRTVELTPSGINGHAVKDPVIVRQGPVSFMYVSYAPASLTRELRPDDHLHASDDVFTTGLVKSHTGLAIGLANHPHRWVGEVLSASVTGWDSLVSRITGLMPLDTVYLAFYDGSASVTENYEERVGVALTADLKHFYKVPGKEPWMCSSYGSLRYVAPVKTPDGWILYYEARTASGSHVLCGRKVGHW
ncbi:hypothetical protein [Sulfobacillus thermosulfidooxidans]|uniref:hypothetical protein n=1 Tax=Sulfobacillus thermosulfidooxidans TaxID=28034 RepID=UPI0006B47407|nr:hypothetical protein [Sulfobacillus thermosulfidooxidans]